MDFNVLSTTQGYLEGGGRGDTHTHTHTHTNTHSYTRTHTYTYTHIHTHTLPPPKKKKKNWASAQASSLPIHLGQCVHNPLFAIPGLAPLLQVVTLSNKDPPVKSGAQGFHHDTKH